MQRKFKSVGFVLSVVMVIWAMTSGPVLAGPTVDAVKARGKVICGANGNRAGFSALDSEGQWQGLDIDTCKAIAAAVLGYSSKVQFLKTTTQTRFTALQTAEVDVLTRNVTWTLSRDSKLGIDFVAPTFYDGQGFMVSKKLGVTSVKDLDSIVVPLVNEISGVALSQLDQATIYKEVVVAQLQGDLNGVIRSETEFVSAKLFVEERLKKAVLLL